jgi:hypothetical protein
MEYLLKKYLVSLWVTAALILLALSFFILFKAEHPVFQRILFDADALYLPVLFQDLFTDQGHLTNWYLTPAPYFFPDYLLFLIAFLCTKSIPYQALIYAFLQTTLLGVVLCYLFQLFQLKQPKIMALLTLNILLFYAVNTAAQPFSLLLFSAFHYGCFIMVIAAFTLMCDYLITGSKLIIILLTCLTCAATYSDSLFLVQWTLPVCITGLCCVLLKIIPFRLPACLPIFTSVLGFYLYPILTTHRTRYPMHLTSANVSAHFTEISNFFGNFCSQAPLISVLLILFYIGLIYYCWQVLFKKITPKWFFFSLFLLLSTVTTLVPLLFVSNFSATIRYCIPITTWPIIAVVLLLSLKVNRFTFFALPLITFFTLALTTEAIQRYQNHHPQELYYPSHIRCIDESLAKYPQHHHGISQYWDAKVLQALSKHHLIMAQYDSHLTRHYWITSKQFYRSKYDFAVRTIHPPAGYKIPFDILQKYNHAPISQVHCTTHDLWISKRNHLKVEAITDIGDQKIWPACKLPTRIGHIKDKSCEISVNKPALSDFLTYGPYETLFPGTYQFEVRYRSPEHSQTAVAFWDVVGTHSNQAVIYGQGHINGSNRITQSFTSQFSIPMQSDPVRIEIRTKTIPSMSVEIISLRLTRIKS